MLDTDSPDTTMTERGSSGSSWELKPADTSDGMRFSDLFTVSDAVDKRKRDGAVVNS